MEEAGKKGWLRGALFLLATYHNKVYYDFYKGI